MSLDAMVEELRKRFREAIEYLKKGDSVQAAEKLYKVAENAIRSYPRLIEYQSNERARREGTWWTKLLDKAARRLRDIYGEELLDAWTTAYKFHQKGFHREQLTIEEIEE